MSFPIFTINTAEHFDTEEAALPVADQQEIVEDLLSDEYVDRDEYLALLDYDYIAEMPYMRTQERMEQALDYLASEVRDAAYWYFVKQEGTVWTYELRYD